MKLGDLTGALLDADFALHETDGNAKAFFRQGQVGIGPWFSSCKFFIMLFSNVQVIVNW
jgi:hypothetical protein